LFVVTCQGDGVPYLASLLRKNHRALRLSTLLCLDEIVKNYGGFVKEYMLLCIYLGFFLNHLFIQEKLAL